MPDLGYSLNIGLSGLRVSQDAISVLGHNIANINTPGYSQQSAVLTTSTTVPFGTFMFGTGSSLAAIQSLRDQFLNLQVTQSIASQAGADIRYQGVESVASAFNDDGTTGLSTQIQQFFASIGTLAGNPESDALRQAVLGQAQTMINAFKSTYETLSGQVKVADQQVGSLVTQVNTLTDQIALLNARIAQQVDPTADNDAIDQRQQLTDQLGKLVGIQVSTDSRNQYQISLDSGAAILVGGISSYKMTASPDAANGNKLAVSVQSGNLLVDVTDKINGGNLGGYLDLRDNILPGYQNQLNRIAGSLASQVNAQNQAGYVPPNASVASASHGVALFNGNFDVAGHPIYTNFINTLTLNPAVTANKSLIATAGAAGTGAGDNANAVLLAGLQSSGTVDVNGDGSVMSGPYTTIVTGLVNTVGTDAQKYNTIATNQQNLGNALQSQKASLSGVDLDQQAAQLLAFQQGYQAAAHFISTVSQLTQQLMNAVQA